VGADRARDAGHRLADVAGSVLTTLLVFGAVPAVLVTVVGDPLANGLGHHWSHTARLAISVLALVAWVAWLACCAQLSRAVVHHVRRGQVGLSDGAPLTDRLAARIAVGILALSTLGGPLVVVAASAGATTTVVAPSSVYAAPPPVRTAAPEAAPTYAVTPGGSLWTIAEEQLGDGADWTAIASLNLGRTMPDGRRFVDPSLICPGWVLIMPAPPSEATADVTSGTEAEPAPDLPDATPPTAAPTPAPIPLTAPSTTPTTAAPTTPATTPHRSAVGSAARDVSPTPGGDGPVPAHRSSDLPELVALGLGAIGCAALARRARRRRLLQHLSAASNADADPSEPAVDTDVLLQRFYDVPALDAFERANCHLGRISIEAGSEASGLIRAVCVGTFGVDFWLTDTGLPAPPGFELLHGGAAWHLPYGQTDAQSLGQPGLPVVLPIGDDDDGTWLLPVSPGACLPLLGPAAADLWRAARRVQEAWSWAEMVTVTEDPDEVARVLASAAGRDMDLGSRALPVLFFGDPAVLPTGLAAQVAVVTMSECPASDLTVLVDALRASIHPLARSVRPHLVGADSARLLDELVAPVVFFDEDDALDDEAPVAHVVDAVDEVEPPEPATAEAPVAAMPAHVLLEPGQVEIKLLTMTPRLDGLREALPPNRERRAIELVAYLALHRPDTVTSDRLRTRVLGSGDADAAAKTLFNTATAARRAMGVDEQGAPLFPPGTRTGQYRVADTVTTDVQRAAGLAEVGNATEDPELAIALLRAALELIEGEPMANALSGYQWWESEGHGGRIAAVLVNAACNLAALATDAQLFELAQWGLERARLVDPYSESLSRAAMQVAAAAGDADRLRREWRECVRRIDELDPGSSPSPRTERLFGELAQAVLI
jgi:DNA-binding SARP family transcriptional activator